MRREAKRENDTVGGVDGRDDPKIQRARIQDCAVAGKQADPKPRKDRDQEADRLRENHADGGPEPCDFLRPRDVASTDIGTDHGQYGRSQAEQDGNEHVVEPRCRAVATDRIDTEPANGSGDEQHHQVQLNGVQRGEETDLENVAEQRPAQPIERQAQARSPARHVPQHHDCSRAVVEGDGNAGACDAEARKRPDAEDERR